MTSLIISWRKQKLRSQAYQLTWIYSCPAFLPMKEVVLPKANPSTKAMDPLPLLPKDFLPVHFHQQANPLYCAPSVENTSPRIVPIPLSCSCHSISQLSLKKNPSKEPPYWLPPPPPLPFSLEPATAKLLLSTLHQSCPCEGHHWPPCCQNQQ